VNPLRYAKALAWTVVLLAIPCALSAQPCTAKQQYDDAEKAVKKAEQELTTLQTKHKLPPVKIAKADQPRELADKAQEKAIRDQTLKAAEEELVNAQKDQVNFGSDPNKGTRLKKLTGLIKAHQDTIAAIRTELDAKKSDVDKIKETKKAGTDAETDVKKLMTGIQLGSNASDVDDAKKQVDDDMAQFEKAYQANQPPELGWWQKLKNGLTGGGAINPTNSPPPVTTAMQCQPVIEKNRALARQQAIREKHLNDYQNVDQNSPNAAGSRTASLQAIKNSEDQMAADLTALRTAVQDCHKELQDGLKKVGTKRTELEQLDPGNAIRDRQEELTKLEADKSLETERQRLVDEQKLLGDLVTRKEADVKNSRVMKEGADAMLDEVNKIIEIEANRDAVTNLKPAYDAAVTDKNLMLQAANTNLAATRTFLLDWTAVRAANDPYQTHKKTFLEQKKTWEDRVKAWQTTKDPATAKALGDERTRLAADKVVLLREKAALVAVLRARNLNYKNLCERKKQLADALKSAKADLDTYKCFTDAATAITEIDTRTSELGAFIEEPRVLVGGPSQLESWDPSVASVELREPTLLEALACKVEDFQLEKDLDALAEEIVLAEFDPTTDEPTDSVPGDLSKNTGAVKVPRYYVFLLTNASNGLYVGDEDGIKQSTRCGFVGGGIGCKPTDLISYRKLLGPFASQDEAQAALCKSITESRIFPIGIGMKGRWQGGNTWYGLWNASVSGCPR